MITWLASYPRSGNTLLRVIIEHVFDVRTYSIYDERPLIYGPEGLEEGQGEYSPERLYQCARASKRMHFVKTHEWPRDDAPAIYVERDGRAASVSYYHYLKTRDVPNALLSDVIYGLVEYGSWSEHYERWKPAHRESCLVVKFEDLVTNPDAVIAQLSAFTGLERKHGYQNDFHALQAEDRSFYRTGSNDANIKELHGVDETLFWIMHGAAMKERGYVAPVANFDALDFRNALIEQRNRHEILMTERCLRRTREIEDDRIARGNVIASLAAQLEACRSDRKTQVQHIESLHKMLEEARVWKTPRAESVKKV